MSDQPQPINIYITGDEEGPDIYGVIYDTEDEGLQAAWENDEQLWRVPVLPLLEQAVRIRSDSDE